MATEDDVKRMLDELTREREELRQARQEVEKRAAAATQKTDEFVHKAQQQVFDSVSEAQKAQAAPRIEQRIVAAVLAIVVGFGSLGSFATYGALERNAADIHAARVEEESDEQRLDAKISELTAARKENTEHEQDPHPHERDACLCKNEKMHEERECWMGAPCNPTGLSLCQNALPEWKCHVQ